MTTEETQPKTTKELIADGISALAVQLEAGNSAALTAHLSTMSRFHRYSFGNVMAIARQRPDASRVAGFHAWKQLGRSVKKGEKAIRILAPMIGGKKEEKSESSDASAPRLYGFRSVCVFDISQTEGEELPAFAEVTGDAGDTLAKLLAFAGSQNIAVEFVADLGNAYGVSYGGRIAILAGESDASTVGTLAHELAHELLHKDEKRTSTNKYTRELEAEAVAFIICSAIGLETGTASADYIKLYSGDSAKLAESLEAISRASTAILTAVLGGAR